MMKSLFTIVGLIALTRADAQSNMPYDPQTISTCTWWYDNFQGETCQAVHDWRFAIKSDTFSRWNPSIGLDCSNWQAHSYYVQVASEIKNSSVTPSPTFTSSSIKSSQTPKPGRALTGWTALGCCVDANTLSTKSSKVIGSNYTIDQCESACFANQYQYAGLKSGTDC